MVSTGFETVENNYVLVLKIGTSTLMLDGNGLPSFSLANIGKFVDTVCQLRRRGHQVVIVSSGAVGAGIVAMHLKDKPKTIPEKQAVAAVGQCRLMRLYEDLFSVREERVAQLLITRTDFVDKAKYINFRNVILELLKRGVIPIINENDSVATERFRFGDNDTFASHCAVSIAAHWLFILSDVDCLYSANPRTHAEAKPIPYVDRLTDVYKILDDKENDGSSWGSGGMLSKIAATKIATTLGINTAITNGEYPERILSILSYAEQHSLDPEKTDCFSFHTHSAGPLTDRVLVCPRPAPPFTSSQHTNSPQYSDSSRLSDSAHHLHTVESLSDMPYLGTIFVAHENKFCPQSMRDQRRWILSLPIRGKISLDMGAVKAVIFGKKSLFAAGVVKVAGKFTAGEAISVFFEAASGDDETDEIARCIVNFNADELNKIKGLKSERFKEVLGVDCSPEVSHRSNIIFMNNEDLYRDVFHAEVLNEETKDAKSLADSESSPTCTSTFPFTSLYVPASSVF